VERSARSARRANGSRRPSTPPGCGWSSCGGLRLADLHLVPSAADLGCQTTGFISVDPLVAVTGQAYSYGGGDPVNVVGPSGCAGALPPQGECAAGGNRWVPDNTPPAYGTCIQEPHRSLVAQVGHAIRRHWRGIVTGVGIVAGIAAAATGIGAIVEGSVALGYASAGFGLLSGVADIPACIGTGGRHDTPACVGAGAGIITGGLGGAGAFVDSGAAALEAVGATAPAWRFVASGLAKSMAFAGGIGGMFRDLFNGLSSYRDGSKRILKKIGALHNPRCSRGLNPPASSRHRAM
jgi:hypothetical protein